MSFVPQKQLAPEHLAAPNELAALRDRYSVEIMASVPNSKVFLCS